MNYKPIIVVSGEPNSIFLEIFFKAIKEKINSPLILICSLKLLKLQMSHFKFKRGIRILDVKKMNTYKLDNSLINIIDVKYDIFKKFEPISNKSSKYIKESFSIAFKLIKSGYTNKMINGPISKKYFLNKKFPGITEFIANEFSREKVGMLIYNKSLSVCPLTTHLPIKLIPKKITKKLIIEKITLINAFYKSLFNKKPKIGVAGLNPHCESTSKINEDDKIIRPAIKQISNKNIKVSGPYPADTIFLKTNRKKFDVIVGMYHDQVLTPIKTLFEYDAINITMGLPFLRVSPDHGPNEKMLGKNQSNPFSLIRSIKFLDNK